MPSAGLTSLLVVVALLPLPALAAGQSLVDAAKTEKERRQQVEQANGRKAKSYTQESVESAPPLANDPNIAPAVPLSGASGNRAVTAMGRSSAVARDADWRVRINAARRGVESARVEYERWQSYSLVPGYVLREKSTGRTAVRSIEELQARTRAAKERLDSAQRALADLEEQARRANVTPGALR